MCGPSTHHADDVIQDTYLGILCNIASFRGQASFLSWAYAIARTAHGRRRRREHLVMRRADALGIVCARWGGQAAHALPLDDLVAAGELGEAIAAALASLSDTDRRVLLMRDLEGWSAHEVAERMGLSVPAVKTRLHRARVAMRARLTLSARAA
jgi:RNA polymerase sigma-70 factor, ECF subfamily